MTTQEIKEKITNKHFRFSIDKLSIFLSELFSRVEELEKKDKLKEEISSLFSGMRDFYKEKEEVKDWTPKIREKYWYIKQTGEVRWLMWDNNSYENSIKSFLGIYRTEKEAIEMRDRIKGLIK